MGSFAAPGDSGTAVLELVQDGSALSGSMSFRRRGGPDRSYVARFKDGRIEQSVVTISGDTLGLTRRFSLRAALLDADHLDGVFGHSAAGVDSAGISLARLPHGEAAVDTTFALEAGVMGLAFIADSLWLSTSGDDYLVGRPGSGSLRQVPVFLYPATHWTGSTLASNGVVLWSDYPVTVMHGDGSLSSFSDLVQFDRRGVIERRFSLSHRTSGLAWDGEALWSLSGGTHLYRLDAAGAVTDSLITAVPDMIHLEYAAGRFWGVGWFIRKLYEIDRSGDVVAVYDLPRGPGWDFPGGLACDGSRFYYASADIPSFTIFYRLSLRSPSRSAGAARR